MNVDTLDQDSRGWRQEAIMLRGVENMSTEDVFEYFSEFCPKQLEWIDDNTCKCLLSHLSYEELYSFSFKHKKKKFM